MQQLDGLDTIRAEEWNRLDRGDSPFLSHEFLYGLERLGCLDGHGWEAAHLVTYDHDVLVGAIPLYVKTNSYGEFVFDWSWADAYERAGGRYYPKLVSAIPFTPVRGPRLLTRGPTEVFTASIQEVLIAALIDRVQSSQLSSLHCLFPEEPEADLLAAHGMLRRKGIQFHWRNRSYRDFADFLDVLSSKKRKQIRRERRRVQEQGIEIEILEGGRVSCAEWDTFYEFYCSTFHRRWGSPRFTREFFYVLGELLPRQTLLVMARRGRTPVAGAFAMLGKHTLYGRHWGCSEYIDKLHFELCYYQTIEYCIQNRLERMDAGVQGEHKLNRGFEPVATWSCHWIRQQGFRKAIEEFLRRETRGIDAYIAELNLHLPYKTVYGE